MGRTTVTFDGFDLTSFYIVSDLRIPLLPRSPSFVEVPGMDGALFTGVRNARRTITMTLTVRADDAEGREEAARALAAALAVSEPKPLAIDDDDGRYYLVLPVSNSDGTRYRHHASFDVSFEAYDPVAYGAERAVTVPSGGLATFLVGGTYPTMPRVKVPAAQNGQGGWWKLVLDEDRYLIAKVPDGVGSASLDFDCSNRVLMVQGQTTLLELDADWLVLEPGIHTLAMTGSGAAIVSYAERWL